jgi:hypothetical protein
MNIIIPIIRIGNKYSIHLILYLFLFCGCWSLSTFQSPVVLEKGKNSSGLGFTGYIDQDEGQLEFYEFDGFFRRGLFQNFDGGIKIFGLPGLGGGIQGDLKYQVIGDPFFIAMDMAVFYALGPSLREDEYIHTYGYTPMILIGNKTIYCGFKNIFSFSSEGLGLANSSRSLEASLPALTFGLSIGESFQLMPELNYYLLPEDNLFVIGLGFQIK